jgi:hypothetical protein
MNVDQYIEYTQMHGMRTDTTKSFNRYRKHVPPVLVQSRESSQLSPLQHAAASYDLFITFNALIGSLLKWIVVKTLPHILLVC